jgi:hypothetical protein
MGWVFLSTLHFSPVTITIYQGIKFHFPLSLSQRHIGGVEIWLLSSLTWHQGTQVFKWTPWLPYPQERTLVPIEWGWMGPQSLS